MNDPKLARKRVNAVKKAKEEGIPQEDAFKWVRNNHEPDFEGNHLAADIDRIYSDGD